jgi:hypothetical protein
MATSGTAIERFGETVMHRKTGQEHSDLTNEAGDSEAAALSSARWRAFIKMAAADWSMAAADVACLLERNVIAKTGRALGLNHDARVMLGLTV